MAELTRTSGRRAACGTSGPGGSCSPRAPPSARSSSPTTTDPGSCSPRAARTYVHRYGVRPGQRAVIFTTNGSRRRRRPRPGGGRRRDRRRRRRRAGGAVAGTRGADRLEAVLVDGRWIDCDLLLVSGGWNPAVHLFSQSRGSLRWEPALATYVPDRAVQATLVAGAANGTFDLAGCLTEGSRAGARAATAAGFRAAASPGAPSSGAPSSDAGPAAPPPEPVVPVWIVPSPDGEAAEARMFVDLERDATVARPPPGDSAPASSRSSTSSATRRSAPAATRASRGRRGVRAIAAAMLGQEVGRRRRAHVPRPVPSRQLRVRSPAATGADLARPGPDHARSTRGTSRAAPSSRTSASGSGRATSRATANRWTQAVLRECAAARTGVRPDGCVHARQDRPPGSGRRHVPRPRLHERVLDAQGRARAATA